MVNEKENLKREQGEGSVPFCILCARFFSLQIQKFGFCSRFFFAGREVF